MRLTQFGGVFLPEQEASDNNPIQARSALYGLPNGAFDQDGSAVVFQTKQISRSFKIANQTPEFVDEIEDALIKELGKGRRILRAVKRDGTTYWQTFAKLRSVQRQVNVVRGKWETTLDVTWDQDYPFWMASDDEPDYFDSGVAFDAGYTFDGGHKEHQTITATPVSFTITNNGGWKVPRGQIVIFCQSGASFTDITITNRTNGYWLKYTGTMSDPDRLDIDLLTKTARKNYTTDAYSGISINDGQIDWMTLELGENDMQIDLTAVGGDIELYWQWSRHYL